MVLVFKRKVEVFQKGGLYLGLQLKYKKICCTMYSWRQKFSLKVGFWWLIKGMMKSLEISIVARNSSQSVCFGLICMKVCWIAFRERAPRLLGTPKNYNSPLMLQGGSYERGCGSL